MKGAHPYAFLRCRGYRNATLFSVARPRPRAAQTVLAITRRSRGPVVLFDRMLQVSTR